MLMQFWYYQDPPVGHCMLKADSHIAFYAHAEPLIHTCRAMPLPCSNSAVSVKVCVVARNI